MWVYVAPQRTELHSLQATRGGRKSKRRRRIVQTCRKKVGGALNGSISFSLQEASRLLVGSVTAWFQSVATCWCCEPATAVTRGSLSYQHNTHIYTWIKEETGNARTHSRTYSGWRSSPSRFWTWMRKDWHAAKREWDGCTENLLWGPGYPLRDTRIQGRQASKIQAPDES